MVVLDRKNDTSNDFSIIVGETDKTFSMNFKVENIKIAAHMKLRSLVNFCHNSSLLEYDLTYYMART